MKTEQPPTHYAGFDWAKTHHDMLVIDATGAIVLEFRFEHTASGWQSCQQQLAAFPRLAVAIEAGHAGAPEKLREMGHLVYVINPRSSKAYRMRQRPSGTKTDRGDCLALAQALRFDGQNWTPFAAPDALLLELRSLCREELALVEHRTQLVNKLIAALYEYYPVMLEAFDGWTSPTAWAFVERFPTPEALTSAGRRKWATFLHLHRCYHPTLNERRFALFARAGELRGNDATIAAKSTLAVTLIKLLQTLEKRLEIFHGQIAACFKRHPSASLFASLPGAGPKLAPRLLSELLCAPGAASDARRLQSQAGVAPVSYQSGQVSIVYLRRQCNRFLQHTVHLWVDLSRHRCGWAQAYYKAHRDKGQSHACAVRCLGMRWMKIICAMLRANAPYDESVHSNNQARHGSWVTELVTAKKSASSA